MDEATKVSRQGPRRTRPQVRKRATTQKMTAAKKTAFLMVLGETCNVAASARSVDLSPTLFHKLRQRDPLFQRAWAQALAEGYAKLELTMLERALNGTEKSVTRTDGTITTTREFNERTAMDLLRQHRQTVVAERARAAEATAAAGAQGSDPMAELIARLDEMSDRIADA